VPEGRLQGRGFIVCGRPQHGQHGTIQAKFKAEMKPLPCRRPSGTVREFSIVQSTVGDH